MPPPRTSTSSSSSSSSETGLPPLPTSSRGSLLLPQPLPTPPSPASFFKLMRQKTAEARGGLPLTSKSSTFSSSRKQSDRRRKRLLAATSVALLLLSLGFLFSLEILRTKEENQQEEKVFGQKTAEFVHAKTIKPATEAAAVASLKMKAVAAAAASRASVSLSATATALSVGAVSEAEEEEEKEAIARRARGKPTRKPTRPQSPPRFPISTQPLTAFVGVQSRPVTPRRQALRDTWFPSTPEEKRRLLAPFESPASTSSSTSTPSSSSPRSPPLKHRGVAFRFVVGRSSDPGENQLVAEEARVHDDLLVLEDARESYDNLVLKTVAFFSAAVEAFPGASFVIKLDDDVYARPDNLALVAEQWVEAERDYVGCLMKGGEVFDDKKSAYYEPLNALLPNRKYYGYMSGGAYALSRRAALLLRSRTTTEVEEGELSGAVAAGKGGESGETGSGSSSSSGSGSSSSSSSGILKGPLGGLRPMACEDCAVGLWLLAHDVKHGEDLRMCRYSYLHISEVEVEEEGVEAAAAGVAETVSSPPKTRRKRHSCAPAAAEAAGSAPQAPVVITNRCNGLCDPMQSLKDLHADPACRAPTLGGEGGGVAVGVGPPSSSPAAVAVSALPLGDFWSSNSILSREAATDLECIRVTPEGDIDKSACKEGAAAKGGRR